MIARTAQPGRLDWIGLRAARRAEITPVDIVDVTLSGLTGDHSRPGKRAVTLIQAEHLPAIAALSGHDHVHPSTLRRNLVISGLNLANWRDKTLKIGNVELHLTIPCAPCSRMEEALGHGGYAAMRGHGGWCAEVITSGTIALGDEVSPVQMA